MKIRYDRESDVLDILLKDEQIHHAEEYDQLIINYDEKDKVVEIEILDASKVLGSVLTEVLKLPEKKIIEIS
jgi:uncharacterized protein YuzE